MMKICPPWFSFKNNSGLETILDTRRIVYFIPDVDRDFARGIYCRLEDHEDIVIHVETEEEYDHFLHCVMGHSE